jgi:phosphohistidine phosphatase SixA
MERHFNDPTNGERGFRMQVARLPWYLVSLVCAFVVTDAAGAENCGHYPKSVVVLRHACKAKDSGFADKRLPLCSRGWAQADELLRRLKGYDVEIVYVTTKRRSAQTAAPLLESRPDIQLKPAIEPTPSAAEALMKSILSEKGEEGTAGRSVLYIGHSETLKNALIGLGISEDIGTIQYADGWGVKFNGCKPGKLEKLPSPVPCDSCCE